VRRSEPDGQKLILNGVPFSVIGVIPASFKQPLDPDDVEVWMGAAAYYNSPDTAKRDFRFLIGVGHLKPGVAPEHAQAEINAIANQQALA
jgi:hypothetical protein